MREYSLGTLLDIGAGLSPDVQGVLTTAGARRTIAEDTCLYRQGEPAHTVHYLVSGEVKTVLQSATGDTCLLRLHLAHSLLGLTALSSAAVRDAEARTVQRAEVITIPASEFRAILAANPALGAYVVELLVNRMSDFHHRVGDFLGRNVEQRLAQTLLSLSRADPATEPAGAMKPISLTHDELAMCLGARRPTVTSILNRFAGDGLIEKAGRMIVICDPKRLALLNPDSAARQPGKV